MSTLPNPSLEREGEDHKFSYKVAQRDVVGAKGPNSFREATLLAFKSLLSPSANEGSCAT